MFQFLWVRYFRSVKKQDNTEMLLSLKQVGLHTGSRHRIYLILNVYVARVLSRV